MPDDDEATNCCRTLLIQTMQFLSKKIDTPKQQHFLDIFTLNQGAFASVCHFHCHVIDTVVAHTQPIHTMLHKTLARTANVAFCEEVHLRRIYNRMVLRLNGRHFGTSLCTRVLMPRTIGGHTGHTAINEHRAKTIQYKID